MGSCAAPSAKGDDKFITTDYLQQCRFPSSLTHSNFHSVGASIFSQLSFCVSSLIPPCRRPSTRTAIKGFGEQWNSNAVKRLIKIANYLLINKSYIFIERPQLTLTD
ncbi:hypothetical protein, partial [Escherichia coli]|uniref:hypothetical protein n=1 Tax=Escherichia coli TaxID=562 RepID=UPI001F0374F8